MKVLVRVSNRQHSRNRWMVTSFDGPRVIRRFFSSKGEAMEMAKMIKSVAAVDVASSVTRGRGQNGGGK